MYNWHVLCAPPPKKSADPAPQPILGSLVPQDSAPQPIIVVHSLSVVNQAWTTSTQLCNGVQFRSERTTVIRGTNNNDWKIVGPTSTRPNLEERRKKYCSHIGSGSWSASKFLARCVCNIFYYDRPPFWGIRILFCPSLIRFRFITLPTPGVIFR